MRDRIKQWVATRVEAWVVAHVEKLEARDPERAEAWVIGLAQGLHGRNSMQAQVARQAVDIQRRQRAGEDVPDTEIIELALRLEEK